MRRVSIFVFISAIFVIAIMAAATAFYFYSVGDRYRHSQMMVQRNILFAQNILLRMERSNVPGEIEETALKYGMKWIKERKEGVQLLKGAKLLGRQPTPFGFIDMLEKDGRIYLLINSFGRLILFEDLKLKPYDPKIVWVYFGLTTLLILLIYWAIWLKLKPLKSLQLCIRKFGEGNLDIHCRIEGSDEIAQVSQAIDEAIERIRTLISSRNLFMRNIMHELKTPLAKGTLTVQMLTESKQKERLESIFARLDGAINEFSTIEQLSSGRFPINKRAVMIQDLIDQAIDLAMIDRSRGEFEIAPVRIEADFKLFSIALKNLLDNAMKYSPDKHFRVVADSKKIVVESKGKKLQHPLDYYTRPYTQGEGAVSGLGLGLYIVDIIVKAHGFMFTYGYENEKNRFIIRF